MSTGCYMEVVNHWVLLLRSVLHCLLTNLNLNTFFKKLSTKSILRDGCSYEPHKILPSNYCHVLSTSSLHQMLPHGCVCACVYEDTYVSPHRYIKMANIVNKMYSGLLSTMRN